MVARRLFFSLFVGTVLLSSTFAKDLEIIQIPEGVSYFDINGDGVKDIIVNAWFSSGDTLYQAYSFYLKEEKALRYVPIQLEDGVGAEAAIYTYSKFSGCRASIYNKGSTKISDIRLFKKGEGTYLFFVRKNCSGASDLFNDKCKFKVVVYKYNEEHQVFAIYKEAITNKLYCDAEEVFYDGMSFLMNLIE